VLAATEGSYERGKTELVSENVLAKLSIITVIQCMLTWASNVRLEQPLNTDVDFANKYLPLNTNTTAGRGRLHPQIVIVGTLMKMKYL
jgi:hypothetical protein